MEESIKTTFTGSKGHSSNGLDAFKIPVSILRIITHKQIILRYALIPPNRDYINKNSKVIVNPSICCFDKNCPAGQFLSNEL